jgi:hypothetical protein
MVIQPKTQGRFTPSFRDCGLFGGRDRYRTEAARARRAAAAREFFAARLIKIVNRFDSFSEIGVGAVLPHTQ